MIVSMETINTELEILINNTMLKEGFITDAMYSEVNKILLIQLTKQKQKDKLMKVNCDNSPEDKF